MKMKSFLELMVLSSNLYLISKDTEALEKIKSYSEMGKEKINAFVKEKMTNEDGDELEFVEKLVLKMHEAKEGLEDKIGSVVTEMYHKMNIAHTDQIKKLESKIESLNKELSLTQSKVEQLDKN